MPHGSIVQPMKEAGNVLVISRALRIVNKIMQTDDCQVGTHGPSDTLETEAQFSQNNTAKLQHQKKLTLGTYA